MAVVWDKARYDSDYQFDVEQWGILGGGRNSVRIHYHRHAVSQYLNWLYSRARTDVPGFASITNVAVIGGGFGWSVDYLKSLGINAVAVDTSGFIQSAKTTTEEAELRACIAAAGLDPNTATMIGPDGNQINILAYLMGDQATLGRRATATILNETLSSANSRRNVQRALPATMDAILTEDVLTSYTDAELPGLLANVQALRPNPACAIVHLLSMGDPAAYGSINDGTGTYNWKTEAQWRAFLDGLGYTNHRIYQINPGA